MMGVHWMPMHFSRTFESQLTWVIHSSCGWICDSFDAHAGILKLDEKGKNIKKTWIAKLNYRVSQWKTVLKTFENCNIEKIISNMFKTFIHIFLTVYHMQGFSGYMCFFPREKQREASCWRNYANATWLHGGRPTFTTEIYPSGYVDWVTIPLENIGIYLSPSYSGKYIPVGNLGKYYKQKNGTISGLCRVTSESTKNVLVLPLIFLSKKWHFGGIVLFYTSGRQQL